VEGGTLDVVKSHDGDVVRNAQTVIHESADGSDGGLIVVADHGGEFCAPAKQFVGRLKAQLRRRGAQLELHAEFRQDLHLEFPGHSHKTLPAVIGVGTVAAPTHEGDLAMAQLDQVAQGQFRAATLVEDHVSDPFEVAMAGDSHHGQLDAVVQHGVDEDESLHRAVHQQARVLFNQVGLAVVTGSQIEVALFDEELLDTSEYMGDVMVVQVGHQHADRECLSLAQRAGIEAGPVIELGRGRRDPIAGLLGDRAHARSVVQHQRDGSRRQIQVLAENAQADRLIGRRFDSWL
jgi:hypothetical protein